MLNSEDKDKWEMFFVVSMLARAIACAGKGVTYPDMDTMNAAKDADAMFAEWNKR